VKVAAFAAESHYGAEEHRNAKKAIQYLEQAARAGAQLVCFPEGFPGPCHGNLDVRESPIDLVCQKAKEYGLYVSASNLEKNPEIEDTYYLTHKLISPQGKILANYKRVQPDHPQLNAWLMSGRMHVLPGDEIMVVDTELGKIGLQICSELYVPEITRIQMLKGAVIVLSPVSGASKPSHYRLRETWQCVARARAAENLLYVIISENVFHRDKGINFLGVACVAGPESFLAKCPETPEPCMLTATLDLERIEWLRTRYVESDLLAEPASADFRPIGARTGQIHDRRPEMYQKLVEPQADAFNYFYFKEGLNAWQKEYKKVRGGY
jgi:predicted amidohydrolase